MLGVGLALGAALERRWLTSPRASARAEVSRTVGSPSSSGKTLASRKAKSLHPTPARIIADFAEVTTEIHQALAIKNRIQQCERLITLADEIDPSLFQRFKEMADMILNREAKQTFASELVSNWARIDGVGAAEAVQSLPPNDLRNELLVGLAEVWLDENPGAAMEWILNKAPSASRDDLYGVLVGHLARTDTDKAFNVVNTLSSSKRVRLLQILFAEWGSQEPAAAAEKLLTLKPSEFSDCVEKVLSSWAKVDIQKALAWANALPLKFNRMDAVSQLCQSMADQNPRSAIDLAEKLLYADSQRQALNRIVNKWAAADLGSARSWVESLPNGRNKADALQSLILEWANQDSAGATVYIKSLPPGPSRNSMIAIVAENGARQDPIGAMALLKEFGGQRAVQSGLQNVINIWAQNDPTAAASYLQTLPPGSQRENAIGTVINSWASQDLPATLNFIKSLPATEQKAGGVSLVQSLAESDPQAAAAYAAEFHVEADAYGHVARSWGSVDFDSALSWAKDLKDSKARSSAIENLQDQWIETAPKGMADYLKSVEQSPARSGLLQGLARKWSELDLTSAMAWASSLESEPDKIEAHSVIVSTWAEKNPADAAHFAASLPPGEGQDKAAAAVIQQWSQSDPASAATWAANFPPGETRDEAFQTIASAWADTDAKAAAEWVNTLPTSSAKEAAIGELADTLGRSDPKAGLQWAARITDPEKRLESTKGIFRVWMMDDPLHASEQVKNSSLTEADKSELLIKPNNRPGNVHYSNGNKIVF